MKKLLNILFAVCIIGAIGTGLLYVLVEAAAVITVNGGLALWAEGHLEGLVCILCSLAAITAFLMSYVFRWKTGE